MDMGKTVAVSGVKNAGKTTFLAALIPALKALGLKAAVVKHDGHSFLPDREGTDTFRLLEAGALGTAVSFKAKALPAGLRGSCRQDLIRRFAPPSPEGKAGEPDRILFGPPCP